RRIDVEDPSRSPDATRFDGMTVETWMLRRLRTRAAREIFRSAIGSMFGAEAREMSALAFLSYLQAGGGLIAMSTVDGAAQQDCFAEGAQEVSCRLVARIVERQGPDAVVLGTPVRAITQDADGATVVTERGTFRARWVV